MKEVYGDIWGYPARIRVITTNGDVTKDGLAVMGRGVAYQAAQRWPHIRKTLAHVLTVDNGENTDNHVHCLGSFDVRGGGITLYTFPVKHHWKEQADSQLIERSARELSEWIDYARYTDPVVLPRPGCGNGGLSWNLVKAILEPILDDRFHVIDRMPLP